MIDRYQLSSQGRPFLCLIFLPPTEQREQKLRIGNGKKKSPPKDTLESRHGEGDTFYFRSVYDRRVYLYLYLSIDLFSRRFIVCPHYLGNVVVSPPPIFTPPPPPPPSHEDADSPGCTRAIRPIPRPSVNNETLCAHTHDGNLIFRGEKKEKKKNQSGAPRKKEEREEREEDLIPFPIYVRGGGISTLTADAAFRVQQPLGGKSAHLTNKSTQEKVSPDFLTYFLIRPFLYILFLSQPALIKRI